MHVPMNLSGTVYLFAESEPWEGVIGAREPAIQCLVRSLVATRCNRFRTPHGELYQARKHTATEHIEAKHRL